MKDPAQSRIERAANNRTELAEIKRRYDCGEIDRATAIKLSEPIINRINKATIIKTKELNKKYGMNRKPAIVDFINLMRNQY